MTGGELEGAGGGIEWVPEIWGRGRSASLAGAEDRAAGDAVGGNEALLRGGIAGRWFALCLL